MKSQRLKILTIAQKWMTMIENVKKEGKKKRKGREKTKKMKKMKTKN